MSLIGKDAPKFTAPAVLGNNQIEDLDLSSFKGKYVVLFFYPLDFTFVCPTEIIAFDQKLEQFKDRDCEVIAVSVDSQFTHLAWKNTPTNQGGIGQIKYPLVSDLNKSIATDYDILFNDSIAFRGLFLIDKNGVVRHQVVNDLNLGRSVDEALRTLDALRYSEKHGEVCPADWEEGNEAIKPSPEGIADYLSKHV